MEIVDSQVHLNMVGIEAGIVAMQAAGVDALVIDEFWSFDDMGRPQPGYPLPGGSFRHVQPLAELAVAQHPDRFAYVTRLQPDDPEIEDRIARLRDRPGRLALRLIPYVPHPPDAGENQANARAVGAFAAEVVGQRYARYLSLVERHQVPLFIQVNGIGIPGRLEVIDTICTRHPGIPLVLDHMGVAMPGDRALPRPHRFDQFDDIAGLAERHPNLYLKWGHATRLAEEPYPFEDIRVALRSAVAAFGAQRVMWASDWTLDLAFSSWAESFSYIRDDEQLSVESREWVLGQTVRTLLGWPA